jgi:PTH1 family peptidyl-tRNA hydrolase
MPSDLWLVVGLGNFEPRYQENRHNVGFMVVDGLSETEGLHWRPASRFEAEIAKGSMSGREVVLVKPQTFMNLSGRAAAQLAGFYDVAVERIVAIHDDVDLELGRLRVKRGGGDGGHKGIHSLAQELGDVDFVRVRVGIGRPEVGEVADYVLHDFRPEERELLEQQLAKAAEAVRTVMTRGVAEAMNQFNGRPREKREQAQGEEKDSPCQSDPPGERDPAGRSDEEE